MNGRDIVRFRAMMGKGNSSDGPIGTSGGIIIPVAESYAEALFEDGSAIDPYTNYDDFAEHLWNGGTAYLALNTGGALVRLLVTFFSYNDNSLALGTSFSGDSLYIVYTNGTWTPPTT